MNYKEIIKKEFADFNKFEKIFFPIIIFVIILISFCIKDSKVALVSAVCGITYTILAGKGRISCYFIGIAGTFCYSYISYKNAFWGQLILYLLYYFPMEIIGIYKWSKHLKINSREIEKTKLTKKEQFIYFTLASVISVIFSFVLKFSGDAKPLMDAFTVVFSVLGQLLTVKRCIEQWYVWFLVNFVSLIMWIFAYINGSNCFATILMWFTYLILAVYFFFLWKKEIKY